MNDKYLGVECAGAIGVLFTLIMIRPGDSAILSCDTCCTKKVYCKETNYNFPFITIAFIAGRLIKCKKIYLLKVPIITALGFTEIALSNSLVCRDDSYPYHHRVVDNGLLTQGCKMLIVAANVFAIHGLYRMPEKTTKLNVNFTIMIQTFCQHKTSKLKVTILPEYYY